MSDVYFVDTASAIKWSEEVSSRPSIRSGLDQSVRSGDPVWDIALTISARLAACKPEIAAVTAKSIYGVHSAAREAFLAHHIALKLSIHEAARRKTIDTLAVLSGELVKAERARLVHQCRYPLARIARELGISRHRMACGDCWVLLRGDGLAMIRDWLKMIDRQMGDWLGENGYLSDVNLTNR